MRITINVSVSVSILIFGRLAKQNKFLRPAYVSSSFFSKFKILIIKINILN